MTEIPNLAATRLIDVDHPKIKATVAQVISGSRDQIEQAVRLHDFVRDEIKFGWASAFDRQMASEVLACGVGFCNTKSTLFVALLRASGIPARIQFVTINRHILDGLIKPPSRFVDHSYVEVFLDQRWVATDSYTVDSSLHRVAIARCLAEERIIAHGVHIDGTTEWDGRNASFVQFLNNGSVPDLSDEAFGSFADLDYFKSTGLGRNANHLAARLVIRWLTRAGNRRVECLRHTTMGQSTFGKSTHAP